MSDTFVADTRRSLRRALFRRFKGMGLGQDAVTRSVAQVERSTLSATRLDELAALAAASGQVAAALQTVAPADPALASFVTLRDSVSDSVRDLATFVEP